MCSLSRSSHWLCSHGWCGSRAPASQTQPASYSRGTVLTPIGQCFVLQEMTKTVSKWSKNTWLQIFHLIWPTSVHQMLILQLRSHLCKNKYSDQKYNLSLKRYIPTRTLTTKQKLFESCFIIWDAAETFSFQVKTPIIHPTTSNISQFYMKAEALLYAEESVFISSHIHYRVDFKLVI